MIPERIQTRMNDEIDAAMVALRWRQETEPTARRSWRYDTAKTAAFGYVIADGYREWQRHRGIKQWE